MAAPHKEEWIPPSGNGRRTGLRLHNSLTRSKVEFIPQEGNIVRCYSCGPTTYSSSHIGHARCYVTFDIMRRILEDYFQYNVLWTVNITDLDDKIILRARREYLLKRYADSRSGDPAGIAADVLERALPAYVARGDALAEDDPKRTMFSRIAGEVAAAVDAAKAEGFSGSGEECGRKLVEACSDPLGEWLDAAEGSTVTDHSIFAKLARRYELEFFEDLKALSVRLPDSIPRVTEYVPKIVEFVEKIVENGHGYESNGSVYFDTQGFSKTHQYAKLAPEHVSNAALRDEGEGALAAGVHAGEKRNAADFALWKKSKEGEPAWDSPWGPGRPGWHIECSSMASHVLRGDRFDIHGGGVDLKFPHHDNELAQSEAHFECKQWVNYFLHAGHVHIEGLKMSKSLKNFVTIRDALSLYTGRQIRILFLSYSWDAPMDFSQGGMQTAIERESRLREFFHAAKESVRAAQEREVANADKGGHRQIWGDAEFALGDRIEEARDKVQAYLLDNLDFPKAFAELLALVTECNRYLRAANASEAGPAGHVVRTAAVFITKILRVFGVVSDGTDSDSDFGFPIGSGAEGADLESTLMPHLRALATFRESVRRLARDKADPRAFFELCDQLRDGVLPELGVRLEDRSDGTTAVKLEDPEELRREKQREEEEREALAERKRAAKEEAERKRLEKEALKAWAQVKPEGMFAEGVDKHGRKWGAFDDQGVPTHDADGSDLPDEARDALLKERKAHEKLRKKLKIKD